MTPGPAGTSPLLWLRIASDGLPPPGWTLEVSAAPPESSEAVNRLFPQACGIRGSYPRAFGTPSHVVKEHVVKEQVVGATSLCKNNHRKKTHRTPSRRCDIAERIYTRAERGRLEPLEEKPFSTEDELQALIAEHPELLDGEQIRPGDPRRWILISREKGIAETSDAAARWAIDHLIIDQDAVPTLAEVKRGSNPEIRRTIVGQMLEYAAHAAQTWTADELRQTFEKSTNERGLDPSHELATLLQADGEVDADRFWRDVSTNLEARRLRLLFVADDIPDPLERVVEFLNRQMPDIEVLAVEIKQFRGKSTQALVPRVIGKDRIRFPPGRFAPEH